MKEIEKFTNFFNNLGELCFRIHMVERANDVFDFTTSENQIINSEYFKKIKTTYPDVIRGFYLAMQRQGECLQFFLTQDFSIIVEYCNSYLEKEVVKAVRYPSLDAAKENIPGYVNYLTQSWNPLK